MINVVRRALITAAAPDQHTLPLQQLVDRKGTAKSALQLIVEEVLQAGVEEIGVVIQPGDEDEYRRAAGRDVGRLVFLEQKESLGYGDAILRARDFIGDQPFLHLVGDHVYLSKSERGCAQQLVDVARTFSCSVSAVQETRETKLGYFGTVGGTLVHSQPGVYEISRVVEKPTPTLAEQELIIAGIRAGYYLCFMGMHVLTPTFMTILESLMKGADPRTVRPSDALALLSQRERYLALAVEGTRFNLGMKYGILVAQLALALSGPDRGIILTELVELLATGSVSPSR